MALQKSCLLHILKNKDIMQHVIMNIENDDRKYMSELLDSQIIPCIEYCSRKLTNSLQYGCKYVIGNCGYRKIFHMCSQYFDICYQCRKPLCKYCKDDTYDMFCKKCTIILKHNRKYICDECFTNNVIRVEHCFECDHPRLLCQHYHDDDCSECTSSSSDDES